MNRTNQSERIFKGIAAASGVAHGPAFILADGELDIPEYSVEPDKREEEIARFEQGLMETRKQISAIRAEVEEKLGENEASIFDAHQLVLEDRALIEDTIHEVAESGLNIEYCFQKVADRYVDAFAQIDDDYIKERVADIRDVTKRVICNLLGHDHGGAAEMEDSEHILIGHDLSPSQTAILKVEKVLGIVTEMGSRTSHSVIMARSLDIPCVAGVHNLLSELDYGDHVLVDGTKGFVILNPTIDTLERYGRLQSERQHIREKFDAEKYLDASTADDHRINILLNVEGVENDSVYQKSGAEGVGLFRTENLFMGEEGFPDEEAQFEVYRNMVERCHPYPVTIRTLDLGGDKNPHRSLTGYQEANPFMGFRAIRFCLETPEVFKIQLRAILRASAFGTVKVLYPMISSVGELIGANELLYEAMDELRSKNIKFDDKLEKGSMIEIPSAAVIADHLADHCDFFSIGTNDLIQYLLAVDRVNDRIAHLYEPNHPAVMRSLNFIFEAGKKRNVPVSVCGELAGDPVYAALLIGMGAKELSLTWSSLPEIKYMIRRMRHRDARKLVLRVLRCHLPEEIDRELKGFYREIMGAEIASLI